MEGTGWEVHQKRIPALKLQEIMEYVLMAINQVERVLLLFCLAHWEPVRLLLRQEVWLGKAERGYQKTAQNLGTDGKWNPRKQMRNPGKSKCCTHQGPFHRKHKVCFNIYIYIFERKNYRGKDRARSMFFSFVNMPPACSERIFFLIINEFP